ncbi:hypothetical protein NLX71_20225 [Paenibacillus sp. MZ04-78.2]|uniref:hypothetical protein n=1 Tax=Paenibacillus sp. MZ04-78.2 TaxID=2962034 RepID=UPI0020B8E300|nr:hypothetical protein [Paenibacillus sp. MZ04-78.2]MCP3775604.1 hypothetical protein [Paenibacillus sp. MZ04-78.2]
MGEWGNNRQLGNEAELGNERHISRVSAQLDSFFDFSDFFDSCIAEKAGNAVIIDIP